MQCTWTGGNTLLRYIVEVVAFLASVLRRLVVCTTLLYLPLPLEQRGILMLLLDLVAVNSPVISAVLQFVQFAWFSLMSYVWGIR
jgi:hypothetical protein